MNRERASRVSKPGATIKRSFAHKEICHGPVCGTGRRARGNEHCVVDQDGRNVREAKVSTEPSAIRSALEGFADRFSRIGLEASSLGMWLYRELHAAGLPVIVVEVRHMHVSLSTMRNKTDRNDARGIAQMMRLGWFRAVHVKNIEMQKMRTLLSNRKLLKRKLVDIENHIRGALRPMNCWWVRSAADGSKPEFAS